jgi:hypothetical protein
MYQRRAINPGLSEDKLRNLAGIYGLDRDSLIETYVLDSVVPGICTNDGCDYAAEYEPDQDGGWCEECGTRTVASALILAGLI